VSGHAGIIVVVPPLAVALLVPLVQVVQVVPVVVLVGVLAVLVVGALSVEGVVGEVPALGALLPAQPDRLRRAGWAHRVPGGPARDHQLMHGPGLAVGDLAQ
jgi:hypothetical protein